LAPAPGSTKQEQQERGRTKTEAQLGPDGELVRPPDRPPTKTEVGEELTPDGPVGQKGKSPPPTLDGIAGEVGRIEQKMLKLMARPALDPESVVDAIKDAVKPEPPPPYVFSGGEYLLSSPCDPLASAPLAADWEGGVGELSELRKKIDAIAELIQHAKNKRQPICHVRATGQPVVVDFVEED
jgi:hypothetical protein